MPQPFVAPSKTVPITGATNDVDQAAARSLASRGAQLVLVGRDQAKPDATVAALRRDSGNDRIEGMRADLSFMGDIRALADAFTARHDRLHVLLNNAGALYADRPLTAEGIERTFALNHLGYFERASRLLDVMRAGAHLDAMRVFPRIANGRICGHDIDTPSDWKDRPVIFRSFGTARAGDLSDATSTVRQAR